MQKTRTTLSRFALSVLATSTLSIPAIANSNAITIDGSRSVSINRRSMDYYVDDQKTQSIKSLHKHQNLFRAAGSKEFSDSIG